MRDRIVLFRLTEGEYQKLIQNVRMSTAVSVSAYLRELLHLGKETDQFLYEQHRELLRQVRKIGVNINQITARHNSGLYFPSDRRRLFEQMEQLLQMVEEYQQEEKRKE